MKFKNKNRVQKPIEVVYAIANPTFRLPTDTDPLVFLHNQPTGLDVFEVFDLRTHKTRVFRKGTMVIPMDYTLEVWDA